MMIPKDWKYQPMKSVLAKVIDYRGKAPPKRAEGVRLITARNVRFGHLDLNHAEYIDEKQYESWMNRGVPCGTDVLFTTEAPLGNACMFPDHGEFAVGQRVITLRPKGDVLSSGYLLNYLLSPVGQNEIHKRSSGSTATGIKSKEFVKIPIPLPPLEEQKQIAEILGTWSRAISVAEKLVRNSQAQKRALTQHLLVGKTRLPGFSAGWRTARIEDISTRVTRRNDGTNRPILTISSTAGFVRQDEKYSRYMAGKSAETYIQLNRGEFAYNKGNSKTYEFGCIFELEDYEVALVPHVYVCFALNSGYCSAYYRALFEADYLHPQLSRVVKTGVRNNGLLNIRPSEFLATTVPVPPIEEQQAIGHVIDAASATIRRHQSYLQKLQLEKVALMQDLLTGKRRIKLAEEAAA